MGEKSKKSCANCVIGRPNNFNSDILCVYKGMVLPDYVCTKHVYMIMPQDLHNEKAVEHEIQEISLRNSCIVCIIAEGSYPYVTGGVSSWIQMLIKGLPEYKFIIYAINAEDKNKGKYKYSIPSNVIDIKEVFLNTFLTEKAAWGKRYKLDEAEKEAVTKLFLSRESNMEALFDTVRNMDSVSDFILSKSFFDILTEAYSEKYSQISFIEFFWMVRSMVLPLFNILKQTLPKADIYHSVSAGYAGVIGAMCKHLYQKPFIITEHGLYTREREEEIIKSSWVKSYFKDMWIDLFYNFSKCAYKNADRVITLFSRSRDIEIEIGCPEEKTQIIPNGINPDYYKEAASVIPDKKRLSIGAVIRMVPIKDIKTMLRAFSYVKEDIPNADFYIMGPTDEDPEYFDECKKMVELLELKDVHFTGMINVRDYLGKMQIAVLTSISEGQPLAILEAMACKKPCVATDVGSCRELLYGNGDSYGDAGIIVPVMDYVKIANAIIKLCVNESLRIEMGENGYRRVLALYTYERFIHAYEAVYKEFGGKRAWRG